MVNKRRVTAVLLFLVALNLSAAVRGDGVSKKEALAHRIESILARARADKAKWAVEVVSLDTGETLYSKNSNQLMIPASNMKLFTTAAALYYLGPGFTTRTSFYYDGALKANGTLNGNLIIYGRGDPNISGRFTEKPTSIFEQVAASLKALGLREVRGDIIGDDSFFDSEYYGPWASEHSRKWYAARVSALSFNDNCIDICVSPGKPGRKANISQAPWTSYPRVINNASTTNSRNGSVWISPGGDGSAVVVSGKIWSRKKAEVLYFPVESPSLYAATVFKETLGRSGISVSGKARTLDDGHKSVVPSGAVPVYEYDSLPLSEMIKVVNKRSQNLHAELILKQVGCESGYGPSFEGGARAVENFVRATGIARDSVIVYDGSGLSTQNRATAHSFVQLLTFMDSSVWRDPFRESLAVVGTDRTLRTLAPVVPRDSILAKTGSLKNAISLSGYAKGKTERLAFSIVANDFRGDQFRIKQVRNQICKELVNY